MATWAEKQQVLRDEGVPEAEIAAYQRRATLALQEEGVPQREIETYWNPPKRTPNGLLATIKDNLAISPGALVADNPLEKWAAGFNMSATDVLNRMRTGNRNPGFVLAEDAGIGDQILSGLGRVAGDLPASIAGFIGGAAASAPLAAVSGAAAPAVGAAGAGFGAAALPEAIRQGYIGGVESGAITTADELFQVATRGVVEAGRAGLIGAVTNVVGGAVAGKVIGKTGSRLLGGSADVTTQAVAGTALDGALRGEIPDADSFISSTVLALGITGAGATVGATRRVVLNRKGERVAKNLRAIYAEHGIPPWEAVQRAKTDKVLHQELYAETADGKPFTAQTARGALREPEPYKTVEPEVDAAGRPKPVAPPTPPAGLAGLIAFSEGSAVFGKRRGIPEAQVISSADAVGRYQVTPGTAHQYMGGAFFGTSRTYDKTDAVAKAKIMEKLKDPEVNEKVANAIIADLAKRYKLPDGAVDIESVLIAYNAGPRTANRFIRKGRSYKTLPVETQRYLQRAEGFKGQIDRGVVEPVRPAPKPECP